MADAGKNDMDEAKAEPETVAGAGAAGAGAAGAGAALVPSTGIDNGSGSGSGEVGAGTDPFDVADLVVLVRHGCTSKQVITIPNNTWIIRTCTNTPVVCGPLNNKLKLLKSWYRTGLLEQGTMREKLGRLIEFNPGWGFAPSTYSDQFCVIGPGTRIQNVKLAETDPVAGARPSGATAPDTDRSDETFHIASYSFKDNKVTTGGFSSESIWLDKLMVSDPVRPVIIMLFACATPCDGTKTDDPVSEREFVTLGSFVKKVADPEDVESEFSVGDTVFFPNPHSKIQLNTLIHYKLVSIEMLKLIPVELVRSELPDFAKYVDMENSDDNLWTWCIGTVVGFYGEDVKIQQGDHYYTVDNQTLIKAQYLYQQLDDDVKNGWEFIKRCHPKTKLTMLGNFPYNFTGGVPVGMRTFLAELSGSQLFIMLRDRDRSKLGQVEMFLAFAEPGVKDWIMTNNLISPTDQLFANSPLDGVTSYLNWFSEKDESTTRHIFSFMLRYASHMDDHRPLYPYLDKLNVGTLKMLSLLEELKSIINQYVEQLPAERRTAFSTAEVDISM